MTGSDVQADTIAADRLDRQQILVDAPLHEGEIASPFRTRAAAWLVLPTNSFSWMCGLLVTNRAILAGSQKLATVWLAAMRTSPLRRPERSSRVWRADAARSSTAAASGKNRRPASVKASRRPMRSNSRVA